MAARRHRWLVIVGAVIAILGVVAGWGWFGWLPGYRPALGAGERYGIDVSHHQGVIDWSKVANDRISFAYIKATEGTDFTDDRFLANWTAAGNAGLQRGAYHFFSLCSPGADQASAFLSVLPSGSELAPAVDLELAGNCAARPTPAEVAQQVHDFLGLVDAATGTPTVVYLGGDFRSAYGVGALTGHPRWTPHFILHPSGDWTVWQVDGFAHVDGVNGSVDLDVMR